MNPCLWSRIEWSAQTQIQKKRNRLHRNIEFFFIWQAVELRKQQQQREYSNRNSNGIEKK